jgi:ATP-dependent DNA helicase PIF1
MVVAGTAGTGKSRIIQTMLSFLGPTRIAVLAPSGVAAFNVQGQTIHSFLKIPVSDLTHPPKDLPSEILQSMQEQLRDLRYVIIDERSFVGQRFFAAIDYRLRHIFPARSHERFGGLSVLLFGDDAQLPPVCDRRL